MLFAYSDIGLSDVKPGCFNLKKKLPQTTKTAFSQTRAYCHHPLTRATLTNRELTCADAARHIFPRLQIKTKYGFPMLRASW